MKFISGRISRLPYFVNLHTLLYTTLILTGIILFFLDWYPSRILGFYIYESNRAYFNLLFRIAIPLIAFSLPWVIYFTFKWINLKAKKYWIGMKDKLSDINIGSIKVDFKLILLLSWLIFFWHFADSCSHYLFKTLNDKIKVEMEEKKGVWRE